MFLALFLLFLFHARSPAAAVRGFVAVGGGPDSIITSLRVVAQSFSIDT
jgi:hypothetical protein